MVELPLTRQIPDAILSGMEPLAPPINPWRGYRNTDKHGSGAWWASRDGGQRHHLGADAIAVSGDEVCSPVDGRIARLGIAYSGAEYKLVEIHGHGRHEGVNVRLLYVQPNVVVGQTVRASQFIGIAQDIALRYPGITNHVHVEVWRAVNPADAIVRMKPAAEA